MGSFGEISDVASSLMSNELLRAQITELAWKGFSDPGILSEDEVWHVCRGMLSYLNGLLDHSVSTAVTPVLVSLDLPPVV